MTVYNGVTALRQIRQGLPSILLAYGPEEYLKQEITNKYLENASGLNLAICSASDDHGLLLQTLGAPPMMALERVTIVKGFEVVWSNQELRDRWQTLIEQLPPYNKLLLIDQNQPNRRLKLYKNLVELGMVVDCQFLKSVDLRRWINREVKRDHKRIEGQAVEALLNLVGNSLQDIKSELQKVLDYTANASVISKEDIEKVVSPSLEAKIFTFVDAIGQRQLTKAYQELEVLYAVGEPPLRIIAMIIRQIRLLLKAKLLLEANFNTQYIMRELRVPEFVAVKLASQCRNFDVEEIKAMLRSIAVTEEHIKTGKIDPKFGLEFWLLQNS